jgi:hypothetical protein
VENKQDYLARVQVAVSQVHHCGATYSKTVPVHEVIRGKTVWYGAVEVFELIGHPKARRVYAWTHRERPDDPAERFVTVLEIPPVVSPETAVRASLMADAKNRKK